MLHIIVLMIFLFIFVCTFVCVSVFVFVFVSYKRERECLLGAVVDLTALGFRASLRHRESTLVLVTAIMDYIEIL